MLSSGFFFLRPYWLLLIIPALGLVLMAMRGRGGTADTTWRQFVDPHLLKALSVSKRTESQSRWLPALLGAGLIAATLAMAGPAWKRIDVPTYESKEPVVVAMSLAQSMNADDITPTRLVRAGHKLRDILKRQEGGDVGLVIYSDRPFVAAPLTEDADVIREMLPELSTELMPVLGNRADLAIIKATELLQGAGANAGRIVLLADNAGTDQGASVAAAKAARSKGYRVEVIGIGADQAATLRTASGEPITGQNGKAMTAAYDADGLRQIADAGGGIFEPLAAGNSDVDRILAGTEHGLAAARMMPNEFKSDRWDDMGYWLLIVPVLLAPLAFRRNVLLMLPIAFTLMAGMSSGRAEAGDLAHLWRTPDQQGARSFEEKDYTAAAKSFDDKRWRAAANYRAGDFASAVKDYAGANDADGAYNRGNALARTGDLKAALDAYDAALKQKPNDQDAKFNRDLVAKLIEQQKAEQKKNEQQQANQQQSGGKGQDQKQANQQQSGGKEQDQKQANQQQSGGKGQDQKQANQQQNGGKEQDQKQANQQQNGGKEQDQKQANQQQNGGKGQDQKQANQQQNGGEGQDQKQANQQQSGGESQDQKQANQQQSGGKGQDQAQARQQQTTGADQKSSGSSEHQAQTHAQANAGKENDSHENGAFRKAMDSILKGNGDTAKPSSPAEPAKTARADAGISEQQQASEQMLRSVPDDASGLLRARIRQNYARYR